MINNQEAIKRMDLIHKRINWQLGQFRRYYKEGHTHKDINIILIKFLEDLKLLALTEVQGELEL